MHRGRLEKPGETGPRPTPLPPYMQIAQTLADQIIAGDYAPESRLPSGAQLCESFGVSSMTLRRALVVLEDQGLVYGVKGSGTFVKSPNLSEPDFQLDPMVDVGLDEPADTRLLSVNLTRADARSAKVLGVPAGTRLVHFRRLVHKNGAPAMYHNEYVLYDPVRPLVESQLQLTALESLLESDGAQRFYNGELIISAVLLDAESAKVLSRQEGDPALSLEHIFFDSEGRPVSYGSFLLRSDLFRLRSRPGTARKVIGVEILGYS
jgi:DNA-binding GntR family transcriptional regulator